MPTTPATTPGIHLRGGDTQYFIDNPVQEREMAYNMETGEIGMAGVWYNLAAIIAAETTLIERPYILSPRDNEENINVEIGDFVGLNDPLNIIYEVDIDGGDFSSPLVVGISPYLTSFLIDVDLLVSYTSYSLRVQFKDSLNNLSPYSALVTFSVPSGSLVSSVDFFGDGSGVALYEFESSLDDTGGQYNATAIGDQSYPSGKFGKGVFIDGSTGFSVAIPKREDNNFTVCNWLNTNEVAYDNSVGLGHKSGDVLYGNELWFRLSGASFAAGISQVEDYGWIDHSINDGTYHFYALSCDGVRMTFYVDMNIVEVYTLSQGDKDALNMFNDFAGINDDYVHFNSGGWHFDQMRIFNRSTSPQEITMLYNERI